MACRRSDRRRLIGCHVGPVRIRGCTPECCPYEPTKANIERNERYNYLTGSTPIIVDTGEQRHVPCRNPHRQKFVCVDCRRVFKPSFIDGNEYIFNTFFKRNYARPSRDRIADVWVEWRRHCRSHTFNDQEQSQLHEKEAVYLREGEQAFDPSELQELRRFDPEFWWKPLDQICCPGCGERGLPVGGTFRAPSRNQAAEWKKVGEVLKSGHTFSYCPTISVDKELREEAHRLKEQKANAELWAAEKQRRISALLSYPLVKSLQSELNHCESTGV